MNPNIDEKIIGSMVESFLKGSYRYIKGWLGQDEDVCIIGNDSEGVPYSICVRAVLEKDGHRVNYTKNSRLLQNLGKVERCGKIILVDNDEIVSKSVSSFARGLLREGYDPNSVRYINPKTVTDARGACRMYLEQNLRRIIM